MNNEENIKKKCIGVFGHYGNSDYGEESIITAVIQSIHHHIPNAHVSCFSLNPEDSLEKYNVKAYPIRRLKKKKKKDNQNAVIERSSSKDIKKAKNVVPENKSQLKKILFLVKSGMKNVITKFLALPKEISFLKTSYKVLTKFDLLIVAGSNQFVDNYGGAGGFPYTLLKWAVLCKMAKVKIAFAGVGAGPLNGWRSKLYIHIALLLADYLSYRDIESKKLVEKTIFPINGDVSPDLAQNLLFETQNPVITDQVKVGINPMAIYDSRYWFAPNEKKYNDYINKLVDFSSWLINEGHSLFFFNMMIKDLNAVEDILNRMEPGHKEKIQVKKVNSVDKLMRIIDSMDIIVGTRFHGFTLPLLAEKPILGLYYYRKSLEIMTELEQDKFAFDIDDFSAMQLKKGFDDLVINFKTAKEQIRIKSNEYKQQLADQYEKIVSLI